MADDMKCETDFDMYCCVYYIFEFRKQYFSTIVLTSDMQRKEKENKVRGNPNFYSTKVVWKCAINGVMKAEIKVMIRGM